MLWIVEGEPVSMAGIARRLTHTAAIAPVYTPAHLRQRGYAGSVTAAVVERIFAEGKTIACLYTDMRNPFSNRCYARVGFKPVCESWHYAPHAKCLIHVRRKDQARRAEHRLRAPHLAARAAARRKRAVRGRGPRPSPRPCGILATCRSTPSTWSSACHHQILYTRIPAYERAAPRAGAVGRQERVRILDARALVRSDRRYPLLHARDEARGGQPQQLLPHRETRRVCKRCSGRIKRDGALTIRDHRRWTNCARRTTRGRAASRAKRALQLAFYPRCAHGEPARGHAEIL